MLASQICLLASQIAKGGTGMVSIAGQGLNAVLEDLKLVRNLKMNRVTQTLNVSAGTNGPFTLESDYLRTYDMFYPLSANGETQFLNPVTMEQFDSDNQASQTADYPYEYATDLSTQAQFAAGSLGPVNGVLGLTVTNAGSYSGVPAIAFAGGTPNVAATATALVGFRSFSVAAQGSGYAVGDLIYASGGVTPAVFSVIAVGGGGFVATLGLVSSGAYSAIPGSGVFTTTTSGAGQGATINGLSYFLTGATVTSSGSYVTAPTASLSGGGGAPQGALSVQFGAVSPTGTGQLYIYPKSATPLAITHRYMRNQPDIATPETSSAVPWFPHSQYLIDRTAWFMMAITGDDRRDSFFKSTEEVLRPYLIMQGDEQQTVQAMRLDPRHFRANRGLRPTKLDPY